MLYPPTQIENADILFVESTYGRKDNPPGDPAAELEKIANETFQNRGVLLIPAFAVGRTHLLLYYFHQLMEKDRIPDVPVYIDSPMATSATYLYYRYPKYHKVKFIIQNLRDMLVFVKSAKHSKELNEIKNNAIIISSSGMMTGGRILHHLYHRLRNKQDTILISGFQAEGTRGRKLVDKSSTIKIFGEEVPVNCRIENMTSLSGHADRSELLSWMKNFKEKPKMTFVVHGENPGLKNYAEAIRETLGWECHRAAISRISQSV